LPDIFLLFLIICGNCYSSGSFKETTFHTAIKMDWTYTVSGLGVGFLVGLTGVGGGALMTPLLIFVYGIPSAIAVGTDLLFAAVTKAGGVWSHNRRGNIEWRIMGLLALGSVPAALLTSVFLQRSRATGENLEPLINFSLGIALILTSLVLFNRHHIQAFAQRHLDKAPEWLRRLRTLLTVMAGLTLGVLVTLSSVGAGALGAAILTFLYPRLPTIRIIGTDIAHAVPLTAVAGLGHFNMGTVDMSLLGSLLMGSLPGIYLGSNLGASIPEQVTRPILASAILVIGVNFIL
jgi:uncharacterized membrane protein YfcA